MHRDSIVEVGEDVYRYELAGHATQSPKLVMPPSSIPHVNLQVLQDNTTIRRMELKQ